jgi:hypothetical protein
MQGEQGLGFVHWFDDVIGFPPRVENPSSVLVGLVVTVHLFVIGRDRVYHLWAAATQGDSMQTGLNFVTA